MPSCTFFGHRDCPASIKSKLRDVLIDLIEQKSVDVFYIGNNGSFDRIVTSTLLELKSTYSHISFFTVLAYLPQNNQEQEQITTIFPEGIENVPKRFAISWRNRWMIDRSEYVVTYVTHDFGGAAKASEIALRLKRHIINLK